MVVFIAPEKHYFGDFSTFLYSSGFTLNLENLENLEKSGKKIRPGKVREKSGKNEANLEK